MLHKDTIERELILPAPIDEVWTRSFGSPDALSSWFPEQIEGEFEVGKNFFLIWGEHRCEARLVEFEPPNLFAYQWHPGEAALLTDHPEAELTTVRFSLSAIADGTKVAMVEFGFSNISEDRREWAFGQNNGGWDEELPKLSKQYQ